MPKVRYVLEFDHRPDGNVNCSMQGGSDNYARLAALTQMQQVLVNKMCQEEAERRKARIVPATFAPRPN